MKFNGEKLSELRKQRRFSRRQLADATGIAESTIEKIETGKTVPKVDTLLELIKALKTKNLKQFFDDG